MLKQMAKRQSLKNVIKLIESATNALPINEQFVADLKASIEKHDFENKRTPSQTYKPSSLLCIRNMYFQVAGAKQDNERRNSILVGITESGTDRHERIQQAIIDMKEHGIDCEYIHVPDFIKSRNLSDHIEIVEQKGYETKLYHNKFNISFLCDGIIKYKNHYYILEIKTESIYKFMSRKAVAEEHYAQACTYSMCFGIYDVMFLYENRDNCDKKAFILHVTDEMIYEHVLDKIELCDYYLKNITVPPIPKDLPKKACQYCNYKEECRKAGKCNESQQGKIL